ncbi:hypothetical protein F5Y07DRAFT_412383 [Xylaria sp. FL0933]|nr:hypothetical protein F5Y07DRAFT_412383 [Xylaria sp. FL0933]
MVFEGEPQALDIHRARNSASESSYKTSKFSSKRARLSLDIQLAQNYREEEDLPLIRQRLDLELEEDHEGEDSEDTEYVQTVLDERLVIKPDLQPASSHQHDQKKKSNYGRVVRDRVTGRMLSETGGSCLRCKEKLLRCTLTFVGKESEVQCAACRRSKALYCVRYHPLGSNGEGIPFFGPRWKNPNFIVGRNTDNTPAKLPSAELEEILREFCEGGSRYVQGQLIAANDVRKFALPPFNGSDLRPTDRPANCETMDWRDVLPVWRNTSLCPRKVDDERNIRKKQLEIARELSFLPEGLERLEAKAALRREMESMRVESTGDVHLDQMRFLRMFRRYQPRKQNLSDVIGEIW